MRLVRHLDHFYHLLEHIDHKLSRVLNREGAIMADLSVLTAEVAENTDAVSSASALLDNLAQQIRDSVEDPAALQALADSLDQNNAALADAVTRNTPAAPA